MSSRKQESRRPQFTWNAWVAVVVLSLALAESAGAISEGITGFAGNTTSSCEFCHSGGVKPQVRFEGPDQVPAGEMATFRFVVESLSAEQPVAGFNIAASDGLLEPLPNESARFDVGELTHETPKAVSGGEAAWAFVWYAPGMPGTATLYGAGLSADGKGNRSGDSTAVTTFEVNVGPPLPCVGDCDGNDEVSVSELVCGIRIALGDALEECPAFDVDYSGTVDIVELVTAIGRALEGCPVVFTPTPEASPTPTRTETPTPATPTVCIPPTTVPTEGPLVEWATYGQNQRRTFFNTNESRITRDNVGALRPKWRYQTGAVVTASPTVAWVDVPVEGRIKIVFVASWDGNLYALRASNGTRLWSFAMKPHPGGSFPYASSAEVVSATGEQRVYVGGGMTLYCLAAATGELRWSFDAGTGCTTCNGRTERNEIEASPLVVDDRVFFGMDVNDSDPGKGGAYALDAEDGRLVWYFDLVTGATCRPDPSDNVRRFDGFHTAEELGLPADFFATRSDCDFDRTETTCGNIWSSFAADPERRLIFSASSNCDTDDDPETPETAPPMTPYEEAVFALTYEGEPAWVWRPREVDNADLAFGGVPNLFEVEIDGVERDVVGVGNKDGKYYVLDRDGMNEITGRVEPYWQKQVVPGGAIGGIIASAAVGEGKVQFSTAIGLSLSNPQRPAAWGLRATDGDVLWSNPDADPSYGPTTAIPGVAFMGSLFQGRLYAYDSGTGEQLFRSPFLGGPVASAATVLDGEAFIGAGVGARGGDPNDIAHRQSLIPSHVSAFCLSDSCDCPTELCDDGDPCTYDFHGDDGACRTEPAPDGIPCMIDGMDGVCEVGICRP